MISRRLLTCLVLLPCVGLGCGSSPSKEMENFNFLWDWTGIIGTGQSLSVGALGGIVGTTPPSYSNLKLDFGGATIAPPFDPTIASLSVVPLVEIGRAHV